MTTYRATTETIACTLTPDDLRETQRAWQKLFRLSLVSRDEIPGGVRLEVHPGSADALRQLIDIERQCCSWATFELDGPVVAITSPGAGESAIREMWVVDPTLEQDARSNRLASQAMHFIGQLAARVGVSPSAIRFYESVGLMQADGRSDSRYRLYGPRAEHRLRFITRAKSMGMKLSEIRRLIEAPRGSREAESATLRRLIASKTAEIESKMVQLRATAVELQGLRLALEAQPPPESCHLGDCACWLPSLAS